MSTIGERYAKLLDEMGGSATGAMLQSDINRGVLPGTVSDWAVSMTPTELAELDRYAWGQQAGLGGLPVATAYEAMKGIDQATGGRLLPAVGALFGGLGDTGAGLEQNETSSPASLKNLKAYVQGSLASLLSKGR